MKRLILKSKRRNRRKLHIRKHINGTAERPRISVFKSNRHMYVQVIDDVSGRTIVSVSSKSGVSNGEKLGEALGKAMKSKKIARAVFDRNGNLYHGVVRAIAEGARKAGIEL